MPHEVAVALRLVGMVLAALGIGILGREQRVTVGMGKRARPRFIALWIGMTLIGIAVAVGAILAE